MKVHSSGCAQILRFTANLLRSGRLTLRTAGQREPIVGTIIQMPVGRQRHPVITDGTRQETAPTCEVPRFSVTLVTFLAALGLGVLDRAGRNCASYGIGFRVAADHRAVTRPLTITGLDRSLQHSAHVD